jgi:tRNA-dihydrouridine synthase B
MLMSGLPVLRIGSAAIEPFVVLAPMAGYTDAPMRSICREFGAGAGFTELVNAAAIVYGSRPTMHLLETWPNEQPVAAHLYGSDPAILGDACARVEALDRFDFIDLNTGCPVRKIVAKGAGAALIRDLKTLGAIVSSMVSSTRLPVTVKTRIGFAPDNMNIEDLVRTVQDAGAAAVFVHARFATRKHGGKADWEALRRAKAACNIPVIGNGGVYCATDAPRMPSEPGVDGIMIGRAAIGNPWIFREITDVLSGRPPVRHGTAEHRAIILEHLSRLVAYKCGEARYRRKGRLSAEAGAALHFRAHLYRYLSGHPGWGRVRKRLNDIHTPEQIIEAVDEVLSKTAS